MNNPDEKNKVTVNYSPDGLTIELDVEVDETIWERPSEEMKRKRREYYMRFPSLRLLMEQADAARTAKATPPPAPEEPKAE